jgi:hypothetical protein
MPVVILPAKAVLHEIERLQSDEVLSSKQQAVDDSSGRELCLHWNPLDGLLRLKV